MATGPSPEGTGSASYVTTFTARNEPWVESKPNEKVVTYTYWDVPGRTKTMADVDGGVTTYQYDAAGRQNVIINPRNKSTTFTFDLASRQKTKELPNNVTTTWTYDKNGNKTFIHATKSSSSDRVKLSYTYDKTNHKTALTDHLAESTTFWAYDNIYQIKNESSVDSGGIDTNVTYTYDEVGNRTFELRNGVLTTYVYDDANQLNSETSPGSATSYTYDAIGNQVLKNSPAGNVYSTYNMANQLSEIEPTSGSVLMTYNAMFQRVRKESETSITKFIYDAKRLLAETTGDNDTTRSYTSETTDSLGGYGSIIGEFDNEELEDVYPDFDAQWSSQVLTDDSGNAIGYSQFGAFGLVKPESSTSWCAMSDVQWNRLSVDNWEDLPVCGRDQQGLLGFGGQAGYYRDQETELYLMGGGGKGRYYDPASGRFNSADRLGYAAGDVNLYRYVGNDPLNAIDPSGNQEDPTWSLGSYLSAAQTYLQLASFGLRKTRRDLTLASDALLQMQQSASELGTDSYFDEVSNTYRAVGLAVDAGKSVTGVALHATASTEELLEGDFDSLVKRNIGHGFGVLAESTPLSALEFFNETLPDVLSQNAQEWYWRSQIDLSNMSEEDREIFSNLIHQGVLQKVEIVASQRKHKFGDVRRFLRDGGLQVHQEGAETGMDAAPIYEEGITFLVTDGLGSAKLAARFVGFGARSNKVGVNAVLRTGAREIADQSLNPSAKVLDAATDTATDATRLSTEFKLNTVDFSAKPTGSNYEIIDKLARNADNAPNPAAARIADEVAALRRIAANNQSASGKLLHQKINLRGAVVAERDALRSSLSSSQRGPVLSGILDRKSGQIFYGLNPEAASVTQFHPLISGRIAGLNQAGLHSEVVALNRALLGRGTSGPVDLSDFVLFNSRFGKMGQATAPVRGPNNIVRCPTCTNITDGVISLSSGIK